MEVRYTRCAGLDVHSKTVVACVLVSQDGGRVDQTVQTFGTMTADLERLATWLRDQQVAQVALESTGVYWWSVFNLLEEAQLPVILVNPQQRQTLPGQKTDVKDAVWLADLARHDLLQASFIPPADIRALRELTRYRATQVRQRAHEVTRLQKVLESANIKLANVATDVLGVSGQQMLAALAQGKRTRPWPRWPRRDCAARLTSWSKPWRGGSRRITGC